MEFAPSSGPSSTLAEILARIFLVFCLDAIGMQFTPFPWFHPIIHFKMQGRAIYFTKQQIYRGVSKYNLSQALLTTVINS
jgi:hypothetical protein